MNFINTKNTFVMLTGLLLIPMQASAAEDVTVVHTDHLGSPVYYTNADGTLVGQVDYTPYGAEVIADTTDEEVNYTGHVLDRDTDLIYAQARYYDPVIGRFLSTDPVTFSPDKPMQFNRYWYASGNPYLYIDPDGNHPWTPYANNPAISMATDRFADFASDPETISTAITVVEVTATVAAFASGAGAVGIIGGAILKGTVKRLAKNQALKTMSSTNLVSSGTATAASNTSEAMNGEASFDAGDASFALSAGTVNVSPSSNPGAMLTVGAIGLISNGVDGAANSDSWQPATRTVNDGLSCKVIPMNGEDFRGQ